MHKLKQLKDFDENWEIGEVTGMVDLYKKLPSEFIDEYNNMVEVVNRLIESNNSNYRERIEFKEE